MSSAPCHGSPTRHGARAHLLLPTSCCLQAGTVWGRLGPRLLGWCCGPCRDQVLWKQEEMLWGHQQTSKLLLCPGCPRARWSWPELCPPCHWADAPGLSQTPWLLPASSPTFGFSVPGKRSWGCWRLPDTDTPHPNHLSPHQIALNARRSPGTPEDQCNPGPGQAVGFPGELSHLQLTQGSLQLGYSSLLLGATSCSQQLRPQPSDLLPPRHHLSLGVPEGG